MKNFFKLFGIIALVAVIGFSMAACGGDDDDDGGNGGGGGSGFPAELLTKDGTFTRQGGWGTRSGGFIVFSNGYSDALGDTPARVSFGRQGWTSDNDILYDLVSINGKTITVKERTANSQPIVLCTDYTVTEAGLTLTGTAPSTSFSTRVQGIYDILSAVLPKMASNDF